MANLLPDLCTGGILACFYCNGTLPSSNDFWNNEHWHGQC